MRYDHQAIEKKWQKRWNEKKLFLSEIDPKKPKYYVLDMFPYPSGAGLHVGHVEGYTATDILARYKRKKGFSVLHPMGWDSFGLPAEQYAIRTGTHPRKTTNENIANFKRQLQALGFSYDWDRELATSDPAYYKWTQWIFTKLYEKGLAYEAEVEVNFCPYLGTVLANEEVEGNLSKEGGYPVIKKALRQWMLKITAYADRLISDLADVDWPESLKKLQINWIGKSEGAEIVFPIEGNQEKIAVFTTRPETIFGVSFLVLAPEHPILSKLALSLEVCRFQKEAMQKSDMERGDLTKEKRGVFTGYFARHPITSEPVPIWIADYVLVHYGTGAVMAVPDGDLRDLQFAQKYALPIPKIFEEDGRFIHSSSQEMSIDGLLADKAKEKICAYIEEKGVGRRSISYKLRDWLFSRQRYWGEPFPILHFEDGTKRALELDELPLLPPDLADFRPDPKAMTPLAKAKDWVELTDPKTGKKAFREINTMPQWAGSCWYYLRFADPNNVDEMISKAAEKYWLPVDMYVGGVEHATLHLLYARFWHKVLFDLGILSTHEPFMTLRNPGIITARSFTRQDGLYLPFEEVEERGGEWFEVKSGERVGSQVEKMSKSKLNGTSPDDCIEEYGADALRLYEMFLGPLEKEKIWNSDAIQGCRRFLQRIYDMVVSDKIADEPLLEAEVLTSRLVDAVLHDIEALQFNTAIAKMMEFLNDFAKLSFYPRKSLAKLAHILSPFAPHMAEEIWEKLAGEGELSLLPFPEVQEEHLRHETVLYVIQINGKVRGRIELAAGTSQEELLLQAREIPNVQTFLEGKEIVKMIFVPNKLLNMVIID